MHLNPGAAEHYTKLGGNRVTDARRYKTIRKKDSNKTKKKSIQRGKGHLASIPQREDTRVSWEERGEKGNASMDKCHKGQEARGVRLVSELMDLKRKKEGKQT